MRDARELDESRIRLPDRRRDRRTAVEDQHAGRVDHDERRARGLLADLLRGVRTDAVRGIGIRLEQI